MRKAFATILCIFTIVVLAVSCKPAKVFLPPHVETPRTYDVSTYDELSDALWRAADGSVINMHNVDISTRTDTLPLDITADVLMTGNINIGDSISTAGLLNTRAAESDIVIFSVDDGVTVNISDFSADISTLIAAVFSVDRGNLNAVDAPSITEGIAFATLGRNASTSTLAGKLTGSTVVIDKSNEAIMDIMSALESAGAEVNIGSVPGPWDGSVDTSWYEEGKSSYIITTPAELAGLAELVNSGNSFSGKTIELLNDIDLADEPWTPIGGAGSTGGSLFEKKNQFSGSFNGNSHTISNLFINSDEFQFAGLFGAVSGSGIRIENVTVTGTIEVTKPSIAESDSACTAGLIAGTVRGSYSNPVEIINCIAGAEGDDSSVTAERAAGIAGESEFYVSFIDCVNYADITARLDDGSAAGAYAGGITGSGDYVTVDNSENHGEIYSKSGSAGGIIATAVGVDILNSDNYGDVETEGNRAGGITGGLDNSTMLNTWNHASVSTSRTQVGGVSGTAKNSRIENSGTKDDVADITVSGCSSVGGIVGTASDNTVIVHCSNAADINAKYVVGGIAGSLTDSVIAVYDDESQNADNEDFIANTGNITFDSTTGTGDGHYYLAGICGTASNSTIGSSSYGRLINKGNIIGSENVYHLSGIVGSLTKGSSVIKVQNNGDIQYTGTNSNTFNGGIVGILSGGTVDDAINNGSIEAKRYAAGIAGLVTGENNELLTCINNGSAASEYAGGIIGQIRTACVLSDIHQNSNDITDTGNTKTGLFIGYVNSTPSIDITLTNCFIGETKLSIENPITTSGYVGVNASKLLPAYN